MRQREAALSKPQTRTQRLEWAERVAREWDDWSAAVFVDEAAFPSSTRHGRRVWASSEVPMSERTVDWVRISGRVGITVSGRVCGDALLPLYVCSGKFNGDRYRDVLSELYWPILREHFVRPRFRCVQDNSPVHRSSAVAGRFELEAPELLSSTLYLPPYSSDLNPI